MARRWRVHHPDLPAEPGSVAELDSAEAHHVHRVLRLRAGERLALFDGRGREWLATLLECGQRGSAVVERVLDTVAAHAAGRPAPDDRTLLVLSL